MNVNPIPSDINDVTLKRWLNDLRTTLTGFTVSSSILSVQTKFEPSASSSASAGEDARFKDYTLTTTVTNYLKCVVTFTPDGTSTNPTSARLTSNTTLRASASAGATFSGFRYYVVEYA